MKYRIVYDLPRRRIRDTTIWDNKDDALKALKRDQEWYSATIRDYYDVVCWIEEIDERN